MNKNIENENEQIFFAVSIICENEKCKNNGKSLNVIYDLDIEDEDMWFDAYGHGGEDVEDFCVICGELGKADLLMRYKKVD